MLTGAGGEHRATRSIAAVMREPFVDLSGRAELSTLAAVFEKARLVVTGDPGVALLAAALARPGLCVFTSADPVSWAAPDPGRNRAIGAPGRIPTPAWMRDFGRCTTHVEPHEPSPDAVIAHTDELLAARD